jgi:O-antigen/teichoic acid export membrane protein
MQRLRRLFSNVIISLLGQVITWTSTLLLTIAYGRFLGDTQFGELYFALTFVSLIGFPIEFGFNQQLTRDVAEKPERALRHLSTTLLLKFLLWSVLYSILLLLCWLLRYPPDERLLVAICGLALLFTSITNTFASMHSVFERTYFSAIGSIFECTFDAAAGFFLLKSGAGIEVMALVLCCGSAIDAIWQGFWCFRAIGIRLSVNRRLMLELFKGSLPFLVYGVLGVIYYRLDTVLLSLLTNDTVVGWYGAAYRLFDTLLFLPSLVISAIMYPIFSKLSLHSEKQLKLAIEKTMNFVLFCGFPIATFLVIAAPQIIGFLYHNNEFAPSIPTLQYLAPGLVFVYANSVLGAVLLSTHHEKKITIMAVAALVFNLTLNLLLIPRIEQLGAAMVTSMTEMLLFGFSVAFMPKKLMPTKSLLIFLRILCADALMGATIWYLQKIPVLAIIPIAATVYIGMALLIGAVPREDLRTLYTTLRRRSQPMAAIRENIDIISSLANLDTTPLPVVNFLPSTPPMTPRYRAYMDADEEPTIPLLQAIRKSTLAQQSTVKLKGIIAALPTQKIGVTTPAPVTPVTPFPLEMEMDKNDDVPTIPRISVVSLPVVPPTPAERIPAERSKFQA